MNILIPQLGHTADGLIFQGGKDPYVSGTFNDLLKWKFAHLNSVDLLFKVGQQRNHELFLLDNNGVLEPIDKEISFPTSETVTALDGCILECL